MKVYNISDRKRFFEKISECKGTVEMIEKDGTHRVISGEKASPEVNMLKNLDGEIRQMELSFSSHDDFYNILSYLLCMYKPAA